MNSECVFCGLILSHFGIIQKFNVNLQLISIYANLLYFNRKF
jgi:hypothetical protein